MSDVPLHMRSADELIKNIKNLQDENAILRTSYNKLADDLQRGEHVDFDWIEDAIYEAATSRMASAYQMKIKELEK